MSQRILPRFTLPNEKAQKPCCEVCNTEHQCKRCLRAICQQCSLERKTLYDSEDSIAVHPCCLFCSKQIDQINEYKNKYKLNFCQDSLFTSKWVNQLNTDKKNYEDILNQFTNNLSTNTTNENIQQLKKQFQILFNQLISSFNYSFSYFYKVITQDIKIQVIYEKIKNVMFAIFVKVQNLPYTPQLIYLTVFFLCFTNEVHSYFIIVKMIQNIYPQYSAVEKIKTDHTLPTCLKTILKMYRLTGERVDINQLQTVAQYLQNQLHIYILSFTVNICSMPVSFFTIDEILSSASILPLYKAIAGMISLCREQIADQKTFEIAILRNVSVDGLKNCFNRLEKFGIDKQISQEVLFDSVEHQKLYEKYKQLESQHTQLEKKFMYKQNIIKQMEQDLMEKQKKIEQYGKKEIKLQGQLLKLSHLIPKLAKLDQISQLYKATCTINQNLSEKCQQLEQKMLKLEKQKLSDDKYRKNWTKLQSEYLNQIVQLKTKNQIMEIQIQAKQIDFNTSLIDKKLSIKNTEIKQLKVQIQNLQINIQYYQLKDLENNNIKYKKPLTDKKDNEEMNINFENYINNFQKVFQQLKDEIDTLKENQSKSDTKIKGLQLQNANLLRKLKQIQSLNKIIKSIPQECNYFQSSEQFERIIEKETNFMKKKTLENIKDSFDKCRKQLRFRIIDSRIKLEKLKGVQPHKNYNDINNQIMSNENNTENKDNFFDVVQGIEKRKMVNNGNNQCNIM